MYSNNLVAAHARIQALESALATKRAPARALPPPHPSARSRPAPSRRGFPIYYDAPASHWPLLVDYWRALRTVPRVSYSKPSSDSLLLWLGYFLMWPFARLFAPLMMMAALYLVVVPSTLVVLVATSLLIAPVAVLTSLKVRGYKRTKRSGFWSFATKTSVWMYYGIAGIYGTALGLGLLLVKLLT